MYGTLAVTHNRFLGGWLIRRGPNYVTDAFKTKDEAVAFLMALMKRIDEMKPK